MNTYKISNAGLTTPQYQQLLDAILWEGCSYLNVDFSCGIVSTDGTTADARAELLPPQTVSGVSPIIFKKDFVQRLSPYEYSGIKSLRNTDAVVDWLMAIFDSTSVEIDLTSQTLAMGFNYIASLPNSPLTPARVTQLLEIK